MAHFAKVLSGKVIDVIVAEQDFFDDFIDTSAGEWLQTSYNTYGGVHYDPETGEPSADQSKALRYNFASIGGNYDSNADAFYANQPYSSWSLNTNTFLWEPPMPMPNDPNYSWFWDEDELQWVAIGLITDLPDA